MTEGLSSSQANEAIAYFYCNRNEAVRRDPVAALKSFVRQLASPAKRPDAVYSKLQQMRIELELKGSQMNVEHCRDILQQMANTYPQTTIVLDALDECDPETRWKLMTALDSLLESNNPVKVFISSRPDVDIKAHFRNRPSIEIKATDNHFDIASFVRQEIVRHPRWNSMTSDLRREIEEILLSKSQGM